jgi:glycosyltransferase involved in cell wall biosynthesis
MPQILVDTSNIIFHDAGTGIQRVVRSVLNGLKLSDGGSKVCPIYATSNFKFSHVPTKGRVGSILGRLSSGKICVQHGDIFLGLDLNAHRLPKYRSQIEAWKLAGVKIVFVVYDLLPHQNPHWFTDRTVEAFNAWLDLVRETADCIVCISNSVKNDVSAWLGDCDRSIRICTIRLSGDIGVPSELSTGEVERFSAASAIENRRYVLMVGTIEPRKGYDVALQAFNKIWSGVQDNDLCLVVVGRPGWKTEELQRQITTHPELNRKLFWLSSADDRVLRWLYKRASGLLMSSRGEGYGLPIAEAMQLGLPVLARDISVFREVGTRGVSFFLDHQEQELDQIVLRWINDRPINNSGSVEKLSQWRIAVEDLSVVLSTLNGVVEPS